MVLQNQHFEFKGKTVFQRVIFHPPLRAGEVMEEEACFMYAVNGRSTLYGETEKQELQSGEGVLIKCGSFLNFWHESPGADPYEAVAVHFYRDMLQRIYQNELPEFLHDRPVPNPVLMQKVEPSEVVRQFIQGLIYYFDHPGLVNEDLIKLKVKELVLLLYRINSSGIRDILHDMFNPGQVEFREVIKAHLYEGLSVEDLADLTNLSLSSFKREFKRLFDDSPARYIKRKRLEKAAELLVLSDKRVTEICFDCGFSDPGHFSKAFIAHFDCPPSTFRKDRLVQKNQ